MANETSPSLWGEYAWLAFILVVGGRAMLAPGPHRASRLLFWPGLAIGQAFDIFEAMAFPLTDTVDSLGIVLMALAFWLYDPRPWLSGMTNPGTRRLVRFIGLSVCTLAVAVFLVTAGILAAAALYRVIENRADLAIILMLEFLFAAVARLSYRTADALARPEQEAAP